MVKSPKRYFRDTGLDCALLGIRSAESLATYYQKGAIFENFIFNELAKGYYNKGYREVIDYFWRDHAQHEVDMLINRGISLDPVEIKSGKTFRKDFFKQLDWFQSITDIPTGPSTVVYGGDEDWEFENKKLLSWKNIDRLLEP